MRLSVIINTLNRPETLKRCLEHLARQKGAADWEIIVVDDGGAADLAPLQEEFQSQIDLRIKHINHAGIGAARNAGATLARGERIWFVGDDVLAAPECWSIHADEQDENVAVLGPYPQPPRGYSRPFNFWADSNHFELISNSENAGYYFFLTGNLSMSRRKFDAIGGFDPDYHPYGWEDVDLGLKFDMAGGRIRFVPEASAVHAHPFIAHRALWKREYWVGYTGRRFYEKWKHLNPSILEPARFWPDPPSKLRTVLSWRQTLAPAVIKATDRACPNSRLNAQLIERMVYSCRLRGFADGDNPRNLKGIHGL